MQDSRTIAAMRREAVAQASAAADFRARARELLALARESTDPDEAERLERRAAKCQNTANAASAPAVAAGRVIVMAEIAATDPNAAPVAAPALSLDEFRAKLAVRKGHAQGGQ